MKMIYCMMLFSMFSLRSEPKGSLYDAWSDWLTKDLEKPQEEEQVEDEFSYQKLIFPNLDTFIPG